MFSLPLLPEDEEKVRESEKFKKVVKVEEKKEITKRKGKMDEKKEMIKKEKKKEMEKEKGKEEEKEKEEFVFDGMECPKTEHLGDCLITVGMERRSNLSTLPLRFWSQESYVILKIFSFLISILLLLQVNMRTFDVKLQELCRVFYPDHEAHFFLRVCDELWIVFSKFVLIAPVSVDKVLSTNPNILHFPFTTSMAVRLYRVFSFGKRGGSVHVGVLADNGTLSMWKRTKEDRKELFRIRIYDHNKIGPYMGDLSKVKSFLCQPGDALDDSLVDHLRSSIVSAIMIEKTMELWILWNTGKISGVRFSAEGKDSWRVFPTFEIPPNKQRLYMLLVTLDLDSSYIWCFSEKAIEIIDAKTHGNASLEMRESGF